MKTKKQMKAFEKVRMAGTLAAAKLPRTKQQLEGLRKAQLVAHALPRTKKQIAAVASHVHLATAAAMLLPKSRRQRVSSCKTIKLAHIGLAKSRKTKRGVCDICKAVCFPYRDHCHTTGRQRGTLCINCNTGIGMFKDSVELLGKAITYLDKYRFRFPRILRFPRLKVVNV